MKLNELKTIDLTAKEWFDKVNGNSYFSARLVLNYGLENQESFTLPFQYGYGSAYEQEASKILHNLFKSDDSPGRFAIPLHLYSKLTGMTIVVRKSIQEGCKKLDVMNFTKGE